MRSSQEGRLLRGLLSPQGLLRASWDYRCSSHTWARAGRNGDPCLSWAFPTVHSTSVPMSEHSFAYRQRIQ